VTERARALAATAALAALVFLVVPASQYLGNLGEFRTAPLPLASTLLLPAALFVVITLAVLRLRPQASFSRYASVVAAVALLAWIQAYLLVWDYGVLDGSTIDWGTPWWRGWADGSLWIAGLAAAARWHRQLGKPLVTAAVVLVALQAVPLAGSAVAQREALSLKAQRRFAATDLDAMAHFSSKRNVLHIVLDSFQADVFKEIVTGPGGAEVQATLPGFTFFEEHLGTFPATYLALPVIVSGQVYRNDVPKPQYVESAFAGKSILNAAHDAGFEVDLATDPLMLDLLMKGRFDHAYLTAQLPLAAEAARLLDLALFRLLPHVLKRGVYNGQRWRVQPLVGQSDLMRFPYFTHNAFLAEITRRFAVDRAAPVYKFFHLMTTHAPFVVHPDCSYVGFVVPRVRETVTAQSRCSMAYVVGLLKQMQKAGIYDDSLVVIMGDHGGHVPPLRYQPGTVLEGGVEYELRPALVGLATPLMAIKPPGARGPFQISQALTSMTDTAATVDALLGLGAGLPGRSMLEANGAAERRFYGYYWHKQDPASRYIERIDEYTVAGSAYDIKSWHMGPTFLPPDER
jgi:hypothetical protein